MITIDLTSAKDGRSNKFDDHYTDNDRMREFLASWSDPRKQGGENTWSHAGAYCRERFENLSIEERRLVFLGMLVNHVNSDLCSHWTEEQKNQALAIAWERISGNR